MKFTHETYREVMGEVTDLKYLEKIAYELLNSSELDKEIVLNLATGGIINPNMFKGFLIAWKICSLQAQKNEVEQLERMAL